MRQHDRYVTCVRCGQVGATLTKVDDDSGNYICLDKLLCQHRQKRCVIAGTLCSLSWCPNKAVVECSCKLKLCKVHAETYAHRNHFLTPIEEK